MKPEYVVRNANPKDINFIFSTWMESFRYGSTPIKTTPKSIYFSRYQTVLDHILGKDEVHTVVACSPEEPDVILGYLVYETPNIVHYSFVKEVFRNIGVAKSLLEHLGPSYKTFTHRTDMLEKYMRNKPEWRYDPFLLYQRSGNV